MRERERERSSKPLHTAKICRYKHVDICRSEMQTLQKLKSVVVGFELRFSSREVT